jgi:hypothetical protein
MKFLAQWFRKCRHPIQAFGSIHTMTFFLNEKGVLDSWGIMNSRKTGLWLTIFDPPLPSRCWKKAFFFF